jgi:hypothetical protein
MRRAAAAKGSGNELEQAERLISMVRSLSHERQFGETFVGFH